MEKQALLGIVPPVIATLVCVVIAWRPWRKGVCPNAAWGSALGLAVGYGAADILIRSWPFDWRQDLFPVGGSRWHPHVALAAAVFVGAASRLKRPVHRMPVFVLLVVGAVALFLRVPIIQNPRGAVPALAAFSVIGLILWLCIWRTARGSQGARVPLMLWAGAAGSAIIFLQSGSATLAQLSGALAAGMGVFVVVGWIRPDLPAVLGAMPVYMLVMLGLLIVARGYAASPQKSDLPFLFAAAAVASPVLTLVPPVRKMRAWVGTLIGLVIALVLGGIGVALTDGGFDFSEFN